MRQTHANVMVETLEELVHGKSGIEDGGEPDNVDLRKPYQGMKRLAKDEKMCLVRPARKLPK